MSYGGRSGHEDFRCQHCHQPIGAASRDQIGTRNRNHCPNCLWSVHVGEDSPKDRRSDCHSGMRPIGLTTKGGGELAIVHSCTGCDTIRINRVAGDDSLAALEATYLASLAMLPETRRRISSAGIKLIDKNDAESVNSQIFGRKPTRY